MEKTPENIKWALGGISQLDYLPGYPQNDAALLGVAKAFLSIVGDRPEIRVEVDPGPEAERGDKKYDVYPFVPVQETVDWLMEQLQDKCEKFPVPYKMRQVYEQRYTPADGKRTQTMGEL